MENTILANRFSKLSICLLSVLLLTSFTISPVYADSPSKGDKISVIVDEMRMHMETVGLKDLEIDEKLTQLEEKLRTGMSTKETCTYCHADKMRQGGKQ